MPRGGKRPGAGRRKGSEAEKTKTRRAIAEKALAEGVSPLDVMLMAMRQHFQDGNLDRAAEVAKDAAPYLHPRLSAITHKSGEEDLDAAIERELAKLAAGNQDPVSAPATLPFVVEAAGGAADDSLPGMPS